MTAAPVEPVATASLLRRLASLVYESLIVFAILVVAALPFAGAATGPLEGLTRHLFQLYLALVLGLYFVWSWRRSGQTLPMKAWRLRLVRRDGRPLDTPRAVLRFALAAAALGAAAAGAILLWRDAARLTGWLALAPGTGALLWALVDRDRQFLHDRLAGTRIVRVARAVRSEAS